MDVSDNPKISPDSPTAEHIGEEDPRVLEAMGRIETIDGADYLDGIMLPPSNDDLFSDEVYTMNVTELFGPVRGELGFRRYIDTFKTPFTNQDMRNETIRSLAMGVGMVYPLEGKHYFIGLDRIPPRKTRMERAKEKLTSLLFGTKPKST